MKTKETLSLIGVTLLLGFMATNLIQNNQMQAQEQEPENAPLIDVITKQEQDIELMEDRIESLRREIDEEQARQTQGLSTINLLRESLQTSRHFAGLTEREGPGVLLTLEDNTAGAAQAKADDPDSYRPDDYIIHDKNLLYIVNDLKAADPDAIAVNDQRIVSSTNIRCVGTVILVNDRRLAPPYTFSVLGDGTAITRALLNSPEVEYLLNQGFPVTYEVKESLTLPAYKGNSSPRYATLYVEPAPEPPADEEPEKEEEETPQAPAGEDTAPGENLQEEEPSPTPTDEVYADDPDASVTEETYVPAGDGAGVAQDVYTGDGEADHE